MQTKPTNQPTKQPSVGNGLLVVGNYANIISHLPPSNYPPSPPGGLERRYGCMMYGWRKVELEVNFRGGNDD
ncbi:hypothetical protein I7I53_08478 [Histoplasma capsulatum var. duboisii H88]|uniref:Uncharacterized protein n=1 Tax=Ajellomyces capsulatus (strain H88) TaxID=544711 RepID=A0A8A1LFC0_AJEC8|nr:hypothetical protein I7I53_08478 [Histoplasma capsulatum var. duboisii H88]